LLFEYSAESYRASDCFSSVMGKNCWYYQQKVGAKYTDLVFEGTSWVGDKCEYYPTRNGIDIYNMQVVKGDLVRKWVAPHAGTVRIEGKVSFREYDVSDITVTILLNEKEIWPSRLITEKNIQTHDMIQTVKKGDAICFVVKGDCQKNPGKITWDPVVTYVN
jgi:hypothetical protein